MPTLGSYFYIVIRSSEAGERFAECNILGSSMETAFKGEDAGIRNALYVWAKIMRSWPSTGRGNRRKGGKICEQKWQ